MARRVSGFAALAAVHLAATAAIGVAVPAPAGAEPVDTEHLTVSAKVAQSCSIASVGSLDFDELSFDQMNEAQTEITFTCTLTEGIDVTVNIGLGDHSEDSTRRMSNQDNSSFIVYEICQNSDCSDPWTEPVDHTIGGTEGNGLPVYARVDPDSLGPDIAADEYSDTLLVTLDY